jgi:hypothetical protein
MAKTIENNHGGSWLDRLLNAWPFCIDAESVRTCAIAWDRDGIYLPEDYSLFYNGAIFLRLCWPFGIWLHLRLVADRRSQFGIGWKLNGRVGIVFRPWQTNTAAAAGAHGPNVGQAAGWERGTA